jgi:protein SCO1/2
MTVSARRRLHRRRTVRRTLGTWLCAVLTALVTASTLMAAQFLAAPLTAAPRMAAPLLATPPLAPALGAPTEYPVSGMVVRVNAAARTFSASIQAIPNFMPAMTMPFEVRQGTDLRELAPGVVVAFTLVVDGSSSRAERIRVVHYQNTEQDPFSASRLKLLSDLAAGRGGPLVPTLAIGDVVPDFTLLDQRRRPVSLSQLRGKVVVANFIYTTCALPNFCLRLANNFGVLQRRFAKVLGRDLSLLTLTFDPAHDTPDVMARYASQWSANADTWRFLTGPPADVERACRLFGVRAFSNEGLMDHSLHTVIIDRQGRLTANIEGNQFTATQLGDVVAAAIEIAARRP